MEENKTIINEDNMNTSEEVAQKEEELKQESQESCSTVAGEECGCESKEDLGEEHQEDTVETMADYDKEISASTQKIFSGDIVDGEIIAVNDEELLVNFGYISDGIIPATEVYLDGDQKLTDLYKLGDKVKAQIIKKDDGDGNVKLSLKKAKSIVAWEKIEKAFNEKTIINVRVKEAVKGGLLCVFEGIVGFMPASLASAYYVEDLNQFVGKDYDVQIIELNQKAKKIIFSRKELEKAELKAKIDDFFDTVQKGDKFEGVVKKIMDFGAFVNIGLVDGLVKLGDLSWSHIKHPSEVVKEGQEVAVSIMDVDRAKKRIRLALEDKGDNPWDQVEEKYSIGEIYEAEVVRMREFGAFVRLEEGVEGLVHVSQIANKHVKTPEDVLKIGEKVQVKVLNIDKAQNRIRLSIKEALYGGDNQTEKSRENRKPRQNKRENNQFKEYQSQGQAMTSLEDVFKDAMKDLNL